MIKIKEDEKFKVVSEASTGCSIAYSEIDINKESLIKFYELMTSLKFYDKVRIELLGQEKIKSFQDCLNKYDLMINNFKKNNSYFIFDVYK